MTKHETIDTEDVSIYISSMQLELDRLYDRLLEGEASPEELHAFMEWRKKNNLKD